GETIAIASSAQGIGSTARLILYGPDGTQIFSHQTPQSGADSDEGRIPDRTAEVQGPRLPGVTSGPGYRAKYHSVTQTGIYRVEFISTCTGGTPSTWPQSALAYNNNWIQPNKYTLIAAWDISVADTAGTEWIPGRVYATVHNLFINSNTSSDLGYHGK